MKARLVSIMLWAPDDWSDQKVADHACWAAREYVAIQQRPSFAKAVTIPDDQVSYKASVIFGETIRPEGEGRGE